MKSLIWYCYIVHPCLNERTKNEENLVDTNWNYLDKGFIFLKRIWLFALVSHTDDIFNGRTTTFPIAAHTHIYTTATWLTKTSVTHQSCEPRETRAASWGWEVWEGNQKRPFKRPTGQWQVHKPAELWISCWYPVTEAGSKHFLSGPERSLNTRALFMAQMCLL